MCIWSQAVWCNVLSPCFICNLQTFPPADLYAHRCLWNSCSSDAFGWKQGNIMHRSETAAHQHLLSLSRKLQTDRDTHRCSSSLTVRLLRCQSCTTMAERVPTMGTVCSAPHGETQGVAGAGWRGVQHKCNPYICSDRQLSRSFFINTMAQSH